MLTCVSFKYLCTFSFVYCASSIMTRLQKPVFPLMSWVGTPRSPSVGALFLLWLQTRCGWNFLGLQKLTRVNVTTLTSLTLHFHGTLHCTFHFHSTPLLLSMAAGLWKDGQKPYQKIIWEMSVKKRFSCFSLCFTDGNYMSGFWAGKLSSNTLFMLWLSCMLVMLQEIDRPYTLTSWLAISTDLVVETILLEPQVNKIFVLIMWSKVSWFWLEIIGTIFTCKHLWTNYPAISSTVLAPS